MKPNKIQIILVSLIFSMLFSASVPAQEQPMLCLTFDDGSLKHMPGYDNETWDRMILDHLKEYQLQAVLYVCGKNFTGTEGIRTLESWDNSGHIIANHTFNHYNYNSDEITFEEYSRDILSCDSLINTCKNYRRYFRAPFLKSGDTKAKRDSLNDFLERINYKNGYVTIDASDWFYNSMLIRFMEDNPGKSIEKFKAAYIEHLLERAEYYDKIASELLGRKVKHSLLLHHNLTSALFLGDLIKAFKENGWQFINAEDALTDKVYNMIPNIVPAGESIIWGLAKESGKYDNILRYPGEDSVYEEERLNKLIHKSD